MLQLASAVVLAGVEGGKSRLRGRFAGAMEKSPYRDLFKVLAAEPGERAADVDTVVQRVSAAAPYQSFLQIYREKLSAVPAKGS